MANSSPVNVLLEQIKSDKVAILAFILLTLSLPLYKALKENSLSWEEIEKVVMENLFLFGMVKSRRQNIHIFTNLNNFISTSFTTSSSHNRYVIDTIKRLYKSRLVFFISDYFHLSMMFVFAGSTAFIIFQQRPSWILLIGAGYLFIALSCIKIASRTSREAQALAEESTRKKDEITGVVQIE